jgi:hypothetical protein
MAATMTRGGEWPDGASCQIGSVVVVSCEDDASDTIVPRLKALDADLSRVHILDWVNVENERRFFDLTYGHLEE